MSLYSQYKTDQDLEVNGIVLNYGKNDKGQNIDFRIARAGGGNTKFAKVAEAVLKPYRRQLNNETLDITVLDGLFRIIYAKAVVLGWSGVEDENGKSLEFNEQNVVKVFEDLPDVFADVRAAAEKASLFRRQALEDESKN